ncbi:S49 family peptidase [Shimia ponticola]|uniref:S49 family peptidase n=1 Tax=Shimia ponticola TaxID=2582893 RepID=UPI0011BEA744|nr:S49 family peptidase [Shimia ponticola]
MKRWIPGMKEDPTVAVVRLEGIIASGRGLNDQVIAPTIEKAFARKPAAVALVINSPGGSPVQSSLIAARIRRLAEEKEVKVYAFVEDVAASGGYWLACAGDEIYVDESSIIGSIGVISAGFGLHELIGRYGVERRVHTAGTSKSMNDPFKPEKAEDVERLKGWLEQIHQSFKDHVARRRAGKLPEDKDLFTGDIWVGASGIDVGLADGVGHVVPKMKEIFGKKTKFKVYQQRKPLLSRIGARVLGDVSHSIEERAAYAQFGL